ncbi:hypothetical protein M8J75_002830 [Diaphorina citri]|nr:hypothetical protein M8J75_002830 [Diaphorina citri]
MLQVLISPVLAGLAVGIGVPILLFYVYGVVPVSLCRSGGCGVSTSPSGGVRFDFDDEESIEFFSSKGLDPDAMSHPNISIGEASDKDSASMMPLTGSIASNTRSFVQYAKTTNDDGSSERVRFDDNVSIIEHSGPAVNSNSPRNRVSSTLRSIFFNKNNNNKNTRSGSSHDNQEHPMKRQTMTSQTKGSRKLPKIPSSSGSNNINASGCTSILAQNKKIIIEVTLSDLHVPTTSSLKKSSSSVQQGSSPPSETTPVYPSSIESSHHASFSRIPPSSKPKKLRSLENLNREIQNQFQKRFFRSSENLSTSSYKPKF